MLTYANLYFKFVLTTAHTVWFIGFFFIFTLGRLMYLYNDRIFNIKLLKNKKQLFLITIIFYVLSNIDSILILKYGHNADYLNTLRMGNVLYSFSLFYLLNSLFNDFKFVIPIDVSFYFIYLIHPFVLKISDYFLAKNNILFFNYPSQFIYSILHFLIVITSCVLVQQLFFKLRYKSNQYLNMCLKNKVTNILICLLFFTFLCQSCSSDPVIKPENGSVVILGSSNAFGVGASLPSNSWAQLLKKKYRNLCIILVILDIQLISFCRIMFPIIVI